VSSIQWHSRRINATFPSNMLYYYLPLTSIRIHHIRFTAMIQRRFGKELLDTRHFIIADVLHFHILLDQRHVGQKRIGGMS